MASFLSLEDPNQYSCEEQLKRKVDLIGNYNVLSGMKFYWYYSLPYHSQIFYPSNQIQCYTHDKLAHTQYSQISNEQEEIQLSVLSMQFPIMNNSGGVCALHGCLAVQKTEHLTAL